MLPRSRQPLIRLLCLVWCLCVMAGCSANAAGAAKQGGAAAQPGQTGAAAGESQSAAGQTGAAAGESQSAAGQTGAAAPARPNTPTVLEPQAPGAALLGADPLTVDVSNAGQGYVMARYNGTAAKANLQITGPDGVAYKYFLSSSADWVPLPLSAGSGSYNIDGYENIADTRYAELFKETLTVQLENDLLPFLYPNQFVDFNADTRAVAVAAETVAGVRDDLEAVAAIYHYVVGHVTYDQQKADTAPKGYLPVVDETLASGTGICFDYAALTAAMLRSQNIPTRLEIGYAGSVYHAWISVYTQETGWIDKLIEFAGDWTRMDPTFASSNDSSTAVLKYIGDGSNYNVQYSR